MEHPELKTKVKHSKSKNAWNVIGIGLGSKHKIARIPYLIIEGNVIMSEIEKNEALRHAEFISFCFNNPSKIQCQ